MPYADEVFADLLGERVAQAQNQRAELSAAIEEMRVARSLTFADDEHDPEGSTVSLDQARDAALLHRTEQTLADRYPGLTTTTTEAATTTTQASTTAAGKATTTRAPPATTAEPSTTRAVTTATAPPSS